MCKFSECDRDARTRGYCNAHYEQFRRGEAIRPIREYVSKDWRCACGSQKHLSKGLCRSCYERKWRDANPSYHRDRNRAYRADPENDETRKRGARDWYLRNREYAIAKSAARRTARGEISTEWAQTLLADPCAYCGEASQTLDHIVPFSTGGASDWTNLTGACRTCNGYKQAQPLLRFLLNAV